jgi:hypothetical protein
MEPSANLGPRLGKADALIAVVKHGVIASQEDVAKNPKRTHRHIKADEARDTLLLLSLPHLKHGSACSEVVCQSFTAKMTLRYTSHRHNWKEWETIPEECNQHQRG